MAVTTDQDPTAVPLIEQANLAQVLPRKAALNVQFDRLQEVQDEILERSLFVTDGAVRFSEVEEGAVMPPQEWIDELGEEKALIRFRAAKAGWKSAKEAPVGIKVAMQMASTIIKAKAMEQAPARTLNVALVHWSTPLPQFPEQEIEPGR